MIDAHVCNKRILRKYPAIMCSICKRGIDVILPEEVIDDYNNNKNAKNMYDKTIRSS